jgi:hypothetical protein
MRFITAQICRSSYYLSVPAGADRNGGTGGRIMWDPYYFELAVAERIDEYLQIAHRERLTKMVEGGNRRRKFRQFRDWIGDVGWVLAARRGAEPNALKGRA